MLTFHIHIFLGPKLYITHVNDMCNISTLIKYILCVGDIIFFADLVISEELNANNYV